MPVKGRVIVRLSEPESHSDLYDTFVHRNAVNFRNKRSTNRKVDQLYLRETLPGRPTGPWSVGTLSYPVDTLSDLLLDINPSLSTLNSDLQHTVVAFYSPSPVTNPEFQQMVAECVRVLLAQAPVHITIFAAERTATKVPPVPPMSAFYGAGILSPEAFIESGFRRREYRAAGSWLGARLESYIPGETKGLGVAIRSGGVTHWFLDCAERREGDLLHWQSFESVLRGCQRRGPSTAFTKAMDVVGSKDATLAFVLAASSEPRNMVDTIKAFVRADKLHCLCSEAELDAAAEVERNS